MKLNIENHFKLILSVGFLTSTLLMKYIRNVGYASTDTSFYDNLLFLPFFLVFIGILVLSLNRYNMLLRNNSYLYVVALFYLLLNITIISQLWIMKYGTFSGVDSWTHLKHIEELISMSKLDIKSNYYPSLVVLLSEISIITKVDPKIAYIYFPIIHVVCYSLILLSLINVYSHQFKKILPYSIIFLLILISPIVLKDSYIVPWSLNSVFILLYIYLFEKYLSKNSIQCLLLLVICLFSLTITHILGMSYILISTILGILFQKTAMRDHKKLEKTSIFRNPNYIILVSVISISWIFIITGFANNQLQLVLQKIPDILYEPTTVQQKIATSKSFSHFLLSWLNLISNMFLVLLSMVYMTYDMLHEKKHERFDSYFESKYSVLNFVLSGFILFIAMKYFIGKTEYSGISIRYLYYTAIVYPILIYYLCLKCSTHININKISIILLLIFIGSTLTIYSRPGYENSSPIITDSLYEGINWGNDKITFNENTKLITAADYIYQYLYYEVGYKKCNEILKGSTRGLLLYLNYDPELYKYRQESSRFSVKSENIVYLYYYNLMGSSTAYEKYESRNLGINKESLENRKNNKIYDSAGFTVFSLRKPEIEEISKKINNSSRLAS